jgi:hypothetical protein|uniref:Uncharacterized protein n=1 Tax=viral metagenome TaxID=1070528 RepID=A0A6C0CZA1_9ZZZZ
MEEDYTSKINSLTKQVKQFVKIPRSNSSFISNTLDTFKSPKLWYILVPFIILILLIIIKPTVIMNENITSDNKVKLTIGYKKLFLTTIILGILIDIALYIHNYRNKK